METNTELLNRIEAHIKGRLAVAESRAASSELYEGKKIAYHSLLGFVHSLRTELAVCPACRSLRADCEEVPTDADLDAEIDSYWKKVTGYQPPFAVLKLKMKDVAKIARHFYNLNPKNK